MTNLSNSGQPEALLLSECLPIAKNAFRWTSFNPEKRGEAIIIDYSNELAKDSNDIKVQAERYNAGYNETILMYQERYKNCFLKWLAAESNCYSAMVTGPAKYNATKAQQKAETASKRFFEFRTWREKALHAILKKIEKSETLTSKIERSVNALNQQQKKLELSIKVNSIIKKNKDRDYTDDLVSIGLQLGTAQQVFKFNAPLDLTPIKRKIKDLSKQIALLKEQEYNTEQVKIETEYYYKVKIDKNFKEGRLQVFFESKPHNNIINALKAKGFRWSPAFAAWQRKLTAQAHFDAKMILETNKEFL